METAGNGVVRKLAPSSIRNSLKRVIGLGVAAVVIGTSLTAAPATVAVALPPESPVHFPFTGEQESWVVPQGVTSVTVTVAGASGWDYQNLPQASGGAGGVVTTELGVTPGQELFILAGEHPIDHHVQAVVGNRSDEEYSYHHGGGGSFLATNDSILVAAGGGGGASRFWFTYAINAEGGAGGFALGSPNGVAGGPDEFGGRGATIGGPGDNGSTDYPGFDAPASDTPAMVFEGVIVPGFGGAARYNTIAGGGGGYFGGGAGGEEASGGLSARVGSGGGGSGFLAPGLAVLSTGTNVGHGYVTITPTRVAPRLSGQTTTTAVVGDSFSYVPEVGGVPSSAVSLTHGALPAGLELNAITGEISGTPAGPGGTFEVTLAAANGVDPEATLDLTIVVEFVEYTVTFDGNGHGEAPVDATVVRGGTVAQPADPTAEGWVFTGWYLDAAAQDPYDFTTVISEDLTLYAGWVPDSESPTLTGPATATATVGERFSYAVEAGGVPSPEISLSSGALPEGLELDAVTGTITGTPVDEAGDYTVVLGAENGIGSAVTHEVTIILSAGAVISLALEPSSDTALQGSSVELVANGVDSAGNLFEIPASEMEYRSSVATDIVDGNTITFPTASPHIITGTHLPSGLTSTVVIEVEADGAVEEEEPAEEEPVEQEPVAEVDRVDHARSSACALTNGR